MWGRCEGNRVNRLSGTYRWRMTCGECGREAMHAPDGEGLRFLHATRAIRESPLQRRNL